MFKSKSACAAFLANYDTKYSVKVTFGNMQYDLPPWSVSVLPDCKTAVFNTARVRNRLLLTMGILIFFPVSLQSVGCLSKLVSLSNISLKHLK